MRVEDDDIELDCIPMAPSSVLIVLIVQGNS